MNFATSLFKLGKLWKSGILPYALLLCTDLPSLNVGCALVVALSHSLSAPQNPINRLQSTAVIVTSVIK